MNDKQLIEVLWSVALSDHMGDVAEAVEPILKHLGLPSVALEDLIDEMRKRDMIPDYHR